MSAYPDTRERRAGEARSHSDRDQRMRLMGRWSEMESDDSEMSLGVGLAVVTVAA